MFEKVIDDSRWLKRFLILLPVFKKPPQKLVLRIRDFSDLIRNWIGRCFFFFHQPHPRSGRVWSLTATFSWGMFGWNLDRKNKTNATFSWKMWLFAVYRGWPTTRLDRDYFISHEIRIPILHQSEFHGSCHGRGFWSLLTQKEGIYFSRSWLESFDCWRYICSQMVILINIVLPFLKLTIRTWKGMVGIRSFPSGMAYF